MWLPKLNKLKHRNSSQICPAGPTQAAPPAALHRPMWRIQHLCSQEPVAGTPGLGLTTHRRVREDKA